METIRAEKIQLTVQLEALKEVNFELKEQLGEIPVLPGDGRDKKQSPGVDETNNGDTAKDQVSEDDQLELPRMRRRILQAENELKRTRTKLLNSQSTLKVNKGGDILQNVLTILLSLVYSF